MVGDLTVLQFLLNSSTRHCKVRLAKNPLPTDMDSIVLADLIECDFDGYGAIADPVFTLEHQDGTSYAEGIAGPLVWTAGVGLVPQQITALYVTMNETGGPDYLLSVNRVGPPVTLAFPGQTFAKKVRIIAADRDT